MIKVFIDGREGTTGLRIEERLSARGDIALIKLPDARRKDAVARKDAINFSDVTFLCLPDAAAKEAVSFANDKVKIIDASTAHRTLDGWAYGFPELSPGHRSAIKSGKRVAVPGCHASGFSALVYPLIKTGAVNTDYPFVCHSLTGYSGGGKSMIAEYTDGNRNPLLKTHAQYALTQGHKHLPEMTKVSGIAHPPVFCPVLGDFYSGMEVTVPLFSRLTNGLTVEKAHGLFSKYYANEPFVKVLPLGDIGRLYAGQKSGSDGMEIYIGGNDERIILSAVFDNLGKGASGAAVQCFNIMCGLPEEIGLTI